MEKLRVYLEIKKDSNIKYEFDKTKNELVVDRILPDPYYYPFAYGFIPNTLADDNDELDILLITEKEYNIDSYVEGYIIGGLEMEDEKGMDEKIFIVPCDEYEKLSDISQMNNATLNEIEWFFSNYKTKCDGKWSKVYGFISREKAFCIYQQCTKNKILQ